MSKKRSPQQKMLEGQSKLSVGGVACILLGLGLTIGSLAQLRVLPSATKMSPTVTPAALSPNSPSKEYIYAGGSLLAIEELGGAPLCADTRTNVELASSGATATASSTYSAGYLASSAI